MHVHFTFMMEIDLDLSRHFLQNFVRFVISYFLAFIQLLRMVDGEGQSELHVKKRRQFE
jgi:hypothetical protein